MPAASLRIKRRTEANGASNRVRIVRPPPAADPLAAVVAGCRRGEAAAQRELVLRTQQQLFRTVFRLTGAQDAEDVVQQVYLQVFRQLDRFAGTSSFGTWLYRVAVNEALQHLRRRRARPTVSMDEPVEHGTDLRRGVELRELLERALEQLEPTLRTMFVLREIEGLTYEQIASVLYIPSGTVASRLNRARHELQERLRALGYSA